MKELQIDINTIMDEYDKKISALNRDIVLLSVQNKELLKKVEELETQLKTVNS
ncbi:hypothetical protein MOD25_05125 [Bacillus haynesii]|uniref:hypothetical protein n=1 Tax=Bacillus haynesii TaxID=1925021 RepID=UPI00227EEE63|nr:hypothetical protein [Bacillus haynesii]MCY8549288.1 hypothetical protein [Bacillus haynesii]